MSVTTVPEGVAIQYANEKENLIIMFLNTIYPNGFKYEEVVKDGEWIVQEDIETFKYRGKEVFSIQLMFNGGNYIVKVMHGNYHH